VSEGGREEVRERVEASMRVCCGTKRRNDKKTIRRAECSKEQGVEEAVGDKE